MSLRVRSHGFELTDGLRAHAERRVHLAIGRFRTRLRAVMLRLDDVNGPRGGKDKRCQILAQLAPQGEVRVEELDSDIYAAIRHAAERLKRAVARATQRRRRRLRFAGAWGGREAAQ